MSFACNGLFHCRVTNRKVPKIYVGKDFSLSLHSSFSFSLYFFMAVGLKYPFANVLIFPLMPATQAEKERGGKRNIDTSLEEKEKKPLSLTQWKKGEKALLFLLLAAVIPRDGWQKEKRGALRQQKWHGKFARKISRVGQPKQPKAFFPPDKASPFRKLNSARIYTCRHMRGCWLPKKDGLAVWQEV